MNVLLVRHAIAWDRDASRWPDDRRRPLTPKGKRSFRRAARGLSRLVPKVDLVLSSRMIRAWETAKILQLEAGWPAPVACAELESAPGLALLRKLRAHPRATQVVLVGHEPSLHELVSYLLAGRRGAAQFLIRKGGAVSLSVAAPVQPGAASLTWLLQPRVLRRLGA